MERFVSLKVDNELTLTISKHIEKYLYASNFYWVLAMECDNVSIEIKNDILYWKSGIVYWGNFIWGVWENGEFRSGTWNGGIFLNGTIAKDVTWLNGVYKGEIMNFKGKKINGEFPSENISK